MRHVRREQARTGEGRAVLVWQDRLTYDRIGQDKIIQDRTEKARLTVEGWQKGLNVCVSLCGLHCFRKKAGGGGEGGGEENPLSFVITLRQTLVYGVTSLKRL